MKTNQVNTIAQKLKPLIRMFIFASFLSFTAAQAQYTLQQMGQSERPVLQLVPLTVEITQPTTKDDPVGLGGVNANAVPHIFHNRSVALEAQTSRAVQNATYQWQVSTAGPFQRIIATGSTFVQNKTQVVNWTPSDNGYIYGDYYLTVVVREASGRVTRSESLLIRIITPPN